MISDEDSQYPKYSHYGNPKRAIGEVCQWCGKNEVTWQMSKQTCSHRCHAAIYLDTYKHMRLFGVSIPILTIVFFVISNGVYFGPIVANVLLLALLLMNGFWVYTFWMVHAGIIMREKSQTKNEQVGS